MEDTGSSAVEVQTEAVEASNVNVEQSMANEMDRITGDSEASIAEEVKRALKLKIDGQEIEYDLSNEDQLKRDLQLSRAAQKRMQEASQMRKQAEDLLHFAKQNPREFFEKVGLNPVEFSEMILSEKLEQEMLTPEERTHREMERKLKEYQDREEQQKREAETKRMSELEEKYAQDIQTQFTTALENSGLPKSPRTIARMAELQMISLNNGLDLNPTDMVELVRQSYITEIQELFGQTDGEALMGLMGESVASKIRKHDLSRIKRQEVLKKQSNIGKQSKPASKKKLSPSELDDLLDAELNR